MDEGFFYHIYNRGINRALIFFEDRNYNFFLKRIDDYLLEHLDLISYCLMPNHFHLIVKIKETKLYDIEIDSENKKRKLSTIEKAFRDFFASYAKAINNSYQRTGALFQARFKRKLIHDDSYLNRLIAYVHLNPVRAKICKNPEDYKYSSYNTIISEKPTKLSRDIVMECFGNKKEFIDFHKFYSDFQKERDFLFKLEKNSN